MHSFHEYEKKGLVDIQKDHFSAQYRIKEANKKLFKTNQKTFFCDICYLESEVKDIKMLDCGHYFCSDCLKDYYNYMVNVSGQAQLIKCPNTDCRAQIESHSIEDLLTLDSYQKFKNLMLNYEVQTSKNKKFCP